MQLHILTKTHIINLCLLLIPCSLQSIIMPTPFQQELVSIKQKLNSLPIDNNYKQILLINSTNQTLTLLHKHKNSYHVQRQYLVSTSKRGLGQIINSKKTPRGLHVINEKFGNNAQKHTIFKARRKIGLWKQRPRHHHFRDYIVTRILQLEGLEPGVNFGRNSDGIIVDSKQRSIYIHGTTMEWKLGKPSSIGCIHMSSDDVIDLFKHTAVGALVFIS